MATANTKKTRPKRKMRKVHSTLNEQYNMYLVELMQRNKWSIADAIRYSIYRVYLYDVLGWTEDRRLRDVMTTRTAAFNQCNSAKVTIVDPLEELRNKQKQETEKQKRGHRINTIVFLSSIALLSLLFYLLTLV